MRVSRLGFVCVAVVIAACGGAAGTELDGPAGPGTDAGGPGADPDGSTADGGGGDAGVACAAGTADCDGDASNGCETNTTADDAHCGGCGATNACASGSSCQAGACVAGPATVVPGGTLSVNDAVCLGVDASYVYVGSGKANGDVYRIPKAGGAPTSIATGQASPRGIGTDATSVFWTSAGSGTVTKANPDGSGPVVLNTAVAAAGANTIAVDAQGVYWGNNTVGSVWRVDKNGANAKQLVPFNGAPGLGQNHISSIFVAAGYVYVSDQASGQIIRVPADGSAGPSGVAAGVGAVRSVTVDVASGQAIFATAASGGQVMKVAMTGPPSTPTPIATGQGNPNHVVTDGKSIYWVTVSANGSIMKLAAGGAATPLVTNQAFPACIAIDGNSLFWVNESGAAIMRVAK